jgi:lysozyme
MKADLERQLRGDEGERDCVYPDSLGYATIGVGRCVDKRVKGAGLRSDEITYLLHNDIDDRINALMKALPWFQNLDDARQGALLNLSFELGVDGLLEFKQTLAAVQGGRYDEAAFDLLQSKYAQEVPARAKRISEQLRTGLWQFAPGT